MNNPLLGFGVSKYILSAVFLVEGVFSAGCQSISTSSLPPSVASSDRLRKEEPYIPPYVECYRNSSSELCFIAAEHQAGFGATHMAIDKVLEHYEPKLIILEGFPSSDGKSPERIKQRGIKLCSDIKSKTCDEGSYAITRANLKNIPFQGGEPTEIEIKDGIKKYGRKVEDLLGFYVVRQIPQWKREGSFKEESLPSRIDKFIQYYAKIIDEKTNFNFVHFKVWYTQKTKKEFSPTEITTDDPAPSLEPGKTEINAISHDVGKIRDAFLVKQIVRLAKEYQKILVVYGQWHLEVNRPQLEENFGPAVMTKKF